jgi:hypothetical protein
MNSSAKTATTHPLSDLSAISAKYIIASVGKLIGGCIVLIAVAYFWALVKNHTPEIDPLFFCIPPLVSIASLAFYLAVEMAKGFGIKMRNNVTLASRKICVIEPWLCLSPLFIYFALSLGSTNKDIVEMAAVLLVFMGIAATIVTKRWAKTSPYLTGCLLLLCGSLCILIALAGIFAIILVLFLLLLPFMIMAIKIAFMAGLSSK